MADIQPGYTYGDAPNNVLNAQNLNELLANAVILPAFISAKTLKTPAALSDKHVIEDGGVLKYVTNQQIHDLVLYPGSVVQTVYGDYTANADLVVPMLWDDTIPQNTEGTEIITISITPRFATSKILLAVDGQAALNVSGAIITAIFRGAGVDAITGGMHDVATATWSTAITLQAMDSPATASPIIYSLRVGPSSGIMRLNGYQTDRRLGGVMRTTLVAQEIKQ